MNLTFSNNDSVPLPVPEAHKHYVMGRIKTSCAHITRMNRSEWCDFYRETPLCSDIVQLVDYMEWISCSDMSREFSIFLIIMFSIILMLVSYANARSYGPNMIAVLYYMNIEEYNAGSLFVNVVNNTPYLFIWLNYDTGRPQDLTISDMTGASLMYLGFTGVFFCIYPLEVPHKWFCKRDTIYQSAMITYILVMCIGEFNFAHAYIWLTIHLLYLILCSMENFLVSVFNTVPRKATSLRFSMDSRFSDRPNSMVSVSEPLPQNIVKESKQLGSVRMMKIKPASYKDDSNYSVHLFADFFKILNPYREWQKLLRFEKTILVAASPFRVLIKLCVPLVDLRMRHSGWSKLLVSVNLVCSTIIFKYGFQINFYSYVCLFLLPSVFVSLFIFGTTSDRTPPKYHHVIAGYGICMSWIISILILNEMFALNNATRLLLGWTSTTSNYSMVAWGLVMEGLITNFTFARMKFTILALGAFFCAPILLINLEFSMKLITYMVSYGVYEGTVKDGPINETGIYFMIIGTWSMTIIAFLTDFKFSRSVGIFFIILVTVFFFYALLSVYEVIHPYGANHDPFSTSKDLVFWA